MDIKPRGKVENLPQGAKGHINALALRIEDLESQLKAASSGNVGLYWSYGIDDIRHGIPQHATVTLVTPQRVLDIHFEDNRLTIYGDRTLIITPRASNACCISFDNK